MHQKKSDFYFQYPANLHTLDLASMVQLYRQRGEPYEVRSSEALACAVSRKILKTCKKWFGLYYSQKAWDQLLTSGSEGYPLTDVELNIMGLFLVPPIENMTRSFVEANAPVISQFAFLIVNDLKQFGFIEETEIPDQFVLTTMGIKALDGLSRRIYEKKFSPDMLEYYRTHGLPGKKDEKQTTLF